MIVVANQVSFLFRFLLLPFLIWLNYVPISRLLSGYYKKEDQLFAVYIGLPFFLFLLVTALLSLVGVFKVEVDLSSNILTIRKALRKSNLTIKNIEGYYVTSLKTNWKEYEGLYLKISCGKTIELSEYNLDSLYEFNQYLIEQKVPCLGKKKSWFPFKRTL